MLLSLFLILLNLISYIFIQFEDYKNSHENVVKINFYNCFVNFDIFN